jgi:hypothetical protein
MRNRAATLVRPRQVGIGFVLLGTVLLAFNCGGEEEEFFSDVAGAAGSRAAAGTAGTAPASCGAAGAPAAAGSPASGGVEEGGSANTRPIGGVGGEEEATGGGAAGVAGAAGSAGVAGGAGSAGVAAAAGSAGTAGTAGTAGAGQTAGLGGSSGSEQGGSPSGGVAGEVVAGTAGAGGEECVFVSAEDCLNGIDDDCNGAIDHADPACESSTQCVPDVGDGFTLGVAVDPGGGVGADCPVRFRGPDVFIHAGLDPGPGCTGCSCTASVTCRAEVYTYRTADACDADVNNTSGVHVGAITTSDYCISGTANEPLVPAGGGFRVTDYETTSEPCTPQGTPQKAEASWARSTRFCAAEQVGAGCSQGYVSVPMTDQPVCILALGESECPTGYFAEEPVWFTGFDDLRTCEPCTCGPQTPGDCAMTDTGNPLYTRLYIGDGTTCNAGIHRSVASGGKNCTVTELCNSAGFDRQTSPQPPTCPAVSQLSGTIEPTGPHTLCCME